MNRIPRPHRTTLLAAFAAALAAAPSLAAEPGAPGGPFEGNVGNALWTLVIFGLVVYVLGKFAWKPILKGLNDREAFIRTALDQAKRDREEAADRLREYHDKLVIARSEATAIVDEARRDADLARRQIEEEAKAEARAAIERAKREIALAQESAVKEIYALSARLSTSVAARVLEREIDPADHERLIRDSIARLTRPEN